MHIYTYIYIYMYIYIYIYLYICKYVYISEFWGKRVLNGKCFARGPRKMSEAIAD